jgi:hypothetical protein
VLETDQLSPYPLSSYLSNNKRIEGIEELDFDLPLSHSGDEDTQPVSKRSRGAMTTVCRFSKKDDSNIQALLSQRIDDLAKEIINSPEFAIKIHKWVLDRLDKIVPQDLSSEWLSQRASCHVLTQIGQLYRPVAPEGSSPRDADPIEPLFHSPRQDKQDVSSPVLRLSIDPTKHHKDSADQKRIEEEQKITGVAAPVLKQSNGVGKDLFDLTDCKQVSYGLNLHPIRLNINSEPFVHRKKPPRQPIKSYPTEEIPSGRYSRGSRIRYFAKE